MLSKTPRLAANVTVWVRKQLRALIALALVLFSALLILAVNDLKTGVYTTPATLGKVKLQLDIASSEDKRVRGLSGRSNLGNNQGMLFVFDQPGSSCMWMKEMNFSIDVLWFDENYVLVDSEQNLSPDTYPQSFCSDQPAQYFLELTAGFITKNNVQIGTKLELH